jgi:hypothetical protein
MPAVQLYVLDDRLCPVPSGAWGELYAGGLCVGRGYLNRPAETAAAFLPDPYGGAPGARMYRTGDIVRIGPAGLLEFRGRADHQIKIRGFRVELGDVEAALSRHPDVRQAAVVVRRGPDGTVLGLAGYAASGRPALTEADLRDHLRAALPDYMVPATLTILPNLPVNANGKIDRDQLPAPAPPSTSDGPVYHAGTANGASSGGDDRPGTELERLVAATFGEVLDLSDVGFDDDLFALGGHSLQVPRIAALLAERTGVEVPLREIFLAPTATGVARAVAAAASGTGTVTTSVLDGASPDLVPHDPMAIPRVDRAARRAPRSPR